MGSGFRTFQSGEVLTADNVQNYLMDQAVMVFSGTAARSSALPTPETGMVAYSTATGVQVYNGTAWVNVGGAGIADFSDAATGTYTDGGINYKYITYTASGTLTVTRAGLADLLIIGGGGSGGKSNGGVGGGGGGAGGYLAITDAYLPVGALTVTIGGGGSGSGSVQGIGTTSRLASFFSQGGGSGPLFSGADAITDNHNFPLPGGSGGGGRFLSTGATGVSGLGNNGGAGSNAASNYGGGGGGGAGAVGSAGTGSAGGNGGAGTASSITGSSVARAGGGGGGAAGGTAGTGAGGGGNGKNNNTAGDAGSANTGGGGGGGGWASAIQNGGNGGSGVVIVRVKV